MKEEALYHLLKKSIKINVKSAYLSGIRIEKLNEKVKNIVK